MSLNNYRTSRPQTSFGSRRPTSNGPKKTYLNNWKPSITPEWVKFVRGYYSTCAVCLGNVQCDPTTHEYECGNYKYANNTHVMEGGYPARCRHKGVATDVSPYCEIYQAFLPNAGPRGMVVQSNSKNGQRPGIPDLLYHYAQMDDTIKIRAAYAHTIIVAGTYHQVEERSARGTAYTKAQLCEGRNCSNCAAGVATVEGNAMAYTPGWGHWSNLAVFNERIGETCLSCRQGTVVPLLYNCPSCAGVIHDLTQSTSADALETYRQLCRELASKDNAVPGHIQCPYCNMHVIPEEVVECRRITLNQRGVPVSEAEGCATPERMSIFDCEVQIRKGSEENTADLVLETFDPQSPITEEQAARVLPNDFMDMTDITPERQSEKMKRDLPPGWAPSARGGSSVTTPNAGGQGGGVRPGGSVNYGTRR